MNRKIAVRGAAAVALLAAVGLLLGWGCRRPEHPAPTMGWSRHAPSFVQEPEIRVALARDEQAVRVETEGTCSILAGPSGETVARGASFAYRIEHAPDGFRLNGGFFAATWLEFRPEDGSRIFLDGKPYPGSMRILSGGNGLHAVNIIGMERYLEGVVGQEMYPSWHPEALKAQAVAARSYALARMAQRERHEYDLLSTVASQRYEGGPVTASVAEAVAATRGVVLVRRGQVVSSYYHSTCGGHTAGASDAFGGKGEEFIRGVRCPHCEGARPFAWTVEMNADELAQSLYGGRSPRGRITALQAIERRPDGRPEKIRVFFGNDYEDILVTRFRQRLGWSRLRSERFWIETAPDGFRFVGRGFGHGVGLCQYGAQSLAEQGATYEQTLGFYYPELRLARLY